MLTFFADDTIYYDDITGDPMQNPYEMPSYRIPQNSQLFTEEEYIGMADTFDDFIHHRIFNGLYHYLSIKGMRSGPVVDFVKFTDDIIRGRHPKVIHRIFEELEVENPTLNDLDRLERDLKMIGKDALDNPIEFITNIIGEYELELVLKSAHSILIMDSDTVQDTIYIIDEARKDGYIDIDDLNMLIKYTNRPNSFVKPTHMSEIFDEVFGRFRLQPAFEKYLIDIDLYSDYPSAAANGY